MTIYLVKLSTSIVRKILVFFRTQIEIHLSRIQVRLIFVTEILLKLSELSFNICFISMLMFINQNFKPLFAYLICIYLTYLESLKGSQGIKNSNGRQNISNPSTRQLFPLFLRMNQDNMIFYYL